MRTVGAGNPTNREIHARDRGVEMTAAQPRRRSWHTEERGCPAWCYECLHNVGPDGALWHRGEPIAVDVYGEREGAVLVPLVVLAEYFDKLPEHRGPEYDVPDLEAPVVRLEVEADAVGLSMTPARARQLAAALIATADTIEPVPQPAEPFAG
jgi:uncharacterized protein DUF6907